MPSIYRALLILAFPFHFANGVSNEPGIAGLWEGALKVGATELRLGFNLAAKPDGSLSGTMDSIDQGAKDIPIDKITFADKKVTLEFSKLKASFAGTMADDGKTIKGEWKQSGLTLPLELKRTEKRTEVRRPQTPKKPYPYDEEEVLIDNKAANVKLAGTLTKPKGVGPFRAAILITGSGPQDRDESLFNHKPFLVLADHLTRKGIAVLRCDDRGVGKSTGDHAKATSADFATDIKAMVAFLKERKDIKDVGLIGHSEGGLIAPMVAADNTDVAFIVSLAGPGVRGDELLIMQGQALLKAAKADDKALAWQRDLQTKLMRMIRDGADANALQTAISEAMRQAPDSIKEKAGSKELEMKQAEKLLASAWIKFFVDYDPRPNLEKVHCPVLALNGVKDTQVPAKENLDEIEKALKAAGNKNVTVRAFPDLNHLFQRCQSGLPDEYGKIEETISPLVLDIISDWIANLK
jgi:hypothetical protein